MKRISIKYITRRYNWLAEIRKGIEQDYERAILALFEYIEKKKTYHKNSAFTRFLDAGSSCMQLAEMAVVDRAESTQALCKNYYSLVYLDLRVQSALKVDPYIYGMEQVTLTCFSCFVFEWRDKFQFMATYVLRAFEGVSRAQRNKYYLPALIRFLGERSGLLTESFKEVKVLGPYEGLVEGWEQDDAFAAELQEALDYRLKKTKDSGDDEKFPYLYAMIPIEILALKKLRLKEGRAWPQIEHPVFEVYGQELPDPQIGAMDERIIRLNEKLKNWEPSAAC